MLEFRKGTEESTEDEIIFDATFLNPLVHLTTSDPDPTLAVLPVGIDGTVAHLLDLLNWMIARGLCEIENTDEEDIDFLEVMLNIDNFQICTNFENSDEDYFTDLLNSATEVLIKLGWSIVEYECNKASDDDSTTMEDLLELEGEDPVEEITVLLRYQIPTINYRKLNS